MREALGQVEKFSNLNFIEVNDTSSQFGDLRFTEASADIMDNALGFAFYPGVGQVFEKNAERRCVF